MLVVCRRYKNFALDGAEPFAPVLALQSARVHMHMRKVDVGPITKLLGALEYLHVIARRTLGARLAVLLTFDEDMAYPAWCVANMLRWAELHPEAAVANAGGNYRGAKHPPAYMGRASRPWGKLRAHPPDLCTAMRANYLYGWAGALYRPEFFDESLTEHLNWISGEGWAADDQYVGEVDMGILGT